MDNNKDDWEDLPLEQPVTSNVADDWEDVPTLETATSEEFEDVTPVELSQTTPSKKESFVRGTAQGGTLGFADEATGAIEALTGEELNAGNLLMPGAVVGKTALNLGKKLYETATTDKSLQDLLNELKGSYTKSRDESREAYKAAEEANPISYGAGTVAGGIASSFVPGLNVAKGAGLLKSAATLGKVGGLASLGLSEAETVPELATDVASGAAGSAVLGSAFPLLGKLYKPAQTAAGAIAQGAGLTGLGAAAGGAYGALSEDLSTEQGREDAKSKALLGAGLAGASRLVPAASRTLKATGLGSEFIDDTTEAYGLAKEGIALVGKKAKGKIIKEVQDYANRVSKLADDIFKSQKQGSFGEQLSAAKKLTSKIDQTRKLVGKEIGDVYNNAVVDSGDFSNELSELDNFLMQGDLNLDERASLRNLNKQLQKFKTEQGYKPLSVKEYLNLRKEVSDLAYGIDTPGSIRKLSKDYYKQLSNKGASTYLDEQTAQEILPALNKEYSLLKNVDELLGQGQYITAEGAVESGPQAIKLIKNLGEETLQPVPLERTQSVKKTLEEVEPKLLEETEFAAKRSGKELRDIKEVEKLSDPMRLERNITELTSYNPEVESASEYQKLLNQLAKTDYKKTKSLLEEGQKIGRKVELASMIEKEGDKTVFSPRAAVFKALTSGATYGNLAGQLVAKAEKLGHTQLGKMLGSVINKDQAGRNAVLFTIMQNPALKKQYDEVMGTEE